MAAEQSQIVLEEVADADELAKARRQDERFARNWAWFEAHAMDTISPSHRMTAF